MQATAPSQQSASSDDPQEEAVMRAMAGFFDPDWYLQRYPDIAATGIDPVRHFIHHGVKENRDPNGFFDSAWYCLHYPDVPASGMHPLLHYLLSGARELRHPNPRFDAVWYADEHPDAAQNPLLFHLQIGQVRGYLTEKPIDIADYLPSKQPLLPQPLRVFVDVVIPVYKGLEETRICLASVLADRMRPLGRIIVIDDRSPDAALSAWLQQLAHDGQIHLVRNPKNVGFVASVNRGMEEAGDHDVVLLNSDTEVPPGWLNRLMAHAYADRRIATVSPMSNNATICSYPGNGGGPMPPGRSVADMDEMCRSVNPGRFVNVPTTVGFCMYIRRDALRDVGLFDVERFTLGYGEENDFCLRATTRSWLHRIACDTFVYHKGSVSFGAKAQKLMTRAMSLLLERFPNYTRDVARYVALDDIAPMRFAITAELFRRSGLPVILMVSHNLGGGIGRHIDNVIEHCAGRAQFLLLEGTDRGSAISVPQMPHHPVLTLAADRLDDLLTILRAMSVSRVHIHHMVRVDADIRAVVRALDVPFDVTVHDYYAICPQINLLPWRHALYCGEPGPAGCNACIAHRSSNGAREILMWRAGWAWQFKEADRVFCPSRDVLARLEGYGLAQNAVFAPHEPVQSEPWPLRIASPGQGKLKIAVLGTLVDHKGGRTVASVAETIDLATTEIHLIGHTDGPFPESALRRMQVTGKYDDADLPRLIEAIGPHILWFPMTWPETFSYTLSAGIDAGTAIAATNIGALVERLNGRPFTWTVDVATAPDGWIRLFEQIRLALRTPPGPAPSRPGVEDFYAARYLPPSDAPKRPVRTRPPHGPPRVHIIPEVYEGSGHPTPCAYIRLLQPLDHPDIGGDLDIRVVDTDSMFDREADIIITQRYAIPDRAMADRLAAFARRTGATLVYDLDDDLLHIPPNHPDARTLQPRSRVVERMLDIADTVWVSTQGLADRLGSVRPDAIVLENRLDERIWTCASPDTSEWEEPIRILCMGTTTHDPDFAMIQPVLRRLKAEYRSRVTIDVLGMTNQLELAGGLDRIGPPPQAGRSYPGFVHWLNTMRPPWHIGLAPLLDSPFNRCKSPLKALDYAALGLAVLASDVPVYRGSLADGPAGQLVPNDPAAWYARLNWMLRNKAYRREMAAGSRAAFLAAGTLAGHAAVRRAALQRLLQSREA